MLPFGDAEDEGADGYGFNPPAIGVDFFQGPLSDPNDGLDNDGDGAVDAADSQCVNAMSATEGGSVSNVFINEFMANPKNISDANDLYESALKNSPELKEFAKKVDLSELTIDKNTKEITIILNK